ncbi:hypothetical protein AAG570_001836 [Ranatra chinensis]|uniref:2',5'-phosphodiesterase 12 n=1 Tax=Ranatra chinensis TaxID=642074 RepID=A0ABD0Y9N2_9HEMI
MHFRRTSGSESFQVQFQFDHPPLNVSREFNFSRRLSENLDAFVDRMRNNIDKVLSKRKARRQKKTGSPVLDEACSDLQIVLSSQGSPVAGTLKCEDIFFNGDTSNLVFHICDKSYTVVVNSPWVKCLSLPSVVMVGFPAYPNKIHIIFGDMKTSKYFWYAATQEEFKKGKWREVGTDMVYVPVEGDVGCKLKFECIPSDGALDGVKTELVTKTEVQLGPGTCPFETRHQYTKNHLDNDSFRIVSYNILAEFYTETEVARNEMFSHCPVDALSLDYRKQLYLKELFGYNADIICLQEVDQKVFNFDLQYMFNKRDMNGIYSLKTGAVNEGIAIFYSTKKFRLKDSYSVVLAEEIDTNPIFSHIWETIKDNKIVVDNFKSKPTVMLILVLEPVGVEGEVLIVGNIHMYYSPDKEYIRLLQGGMFLSLIDHVAKNVVKSVPGIRPSVVMCGDFNSSPECGLYALMTTGHIPDDIGDWKCDENEMVSGLTLRHPYSISSAYGTPEYTNLTANFSGCLDYIYFQNDALLLKQVVPLPSDEEVKKHVALPNIEFPSDHLALVADFGWKKC